MYFIYRVAGTINRYYFDKQHNQFVFGMYSSVFTASYDLNFHVCVLIMRITTMTCPSALHSHVVYCCQTAWLRSDQYH